VFLLNDLVTPRVSKCGAGIAYLSRAPEFTPCFK